MSWFARLRNALNPRRLDEDLAEEMADHRAHRAAALNEKGLSAEEAEHQAHLRFGNATRLKEESREFRLCAALKGTLQDARCALRGMRKSPAFAATAVLSLALAIGANTAVYSIMDAAILRPLPVREPDRLFLLSWPAISDPGSPAEPDRDSFTATLRASKPGFTPSRLKLINLLSKPNDPIQFTLALNTRVLLFCIGVSTVSALFFGLAPAWQASGQQPMNSHRASTGHVGKLRLGKFFVSISREFRYVFTGSPVRVIVVGVVSDAHYYDLRNAADPMVYLPLGGNRSFTLYTRSPLQLGQVVRLVDREAHSLGSEMRIRENITLEDMVGSTLLREKLLARVGGVCAFFGLLLAAVGLFGLLNYSVGRRTKEIGIRAALGAKRTEIVQLVLKDVVGLISGGLIVGLASALAVLAIFRLLLFGIQKADPFVIGTAIGLFLVTGALAASLPAHRAATIDPVCALREE